MQHGRLFVSEFIGTALLVAIGCSLVIVDFGAGSPIPHLMPSLPLRRALTGLLFGSTGAAIALSPVGHESGAHINPVVSLAFCLRGTLQRPVAVGYVLAQLLGAAAGALPLLLWGRLAESVHLAATTVGPQGALAALAGETGSTAMLIVGLFLFLGHRRLRRYTPALFPVLYAFLVLVEAPLSGTSTNPARSLGPDLVGQFWTGWWVDVLGPLMGMTLGLLLLRLPQLRRFREEVAKLYHFEWVPRGLTPMREMESELGRVLRRRRRGER